jgi:hypothetical protein
MDGLWINDEGIKLCCRRNNDEKDETLENSDSFNTGCEPVEPTDGKTAISE